MIVVFSDAAEADLERIADYIARDNPHRASRFVAELIDRAKRLADTPEAYPLVPRHAHHGIRKRSHGAYLIFYRVRDDQIEILHVLNGAQDWETQILPPG